ncbi:MAG TPA: hypothetical protein VFX48_02750 [Saprospiraceae bacterium]|nr:hypothetical protein [Saprospiraceae bacterium]
MPGQLFASTYSFYLECPPSVTIYCYDDVSDLDKWGKAYVWKDYKKSPAPPPVKVIYNTNACGIGTITRYWEVEDPHWNVHKCSQVITVIGGTSFGYADINWPPAYTIDDCNPNADPKVLPAPYNYPTFNRLKCSQPMYSYKDQKFTVTDGCMKILREWKVIDWCQYKPNVYPPVGLWTYTQVIKLVVTDSTAKLICPRDTIVEAKLDCKGTYVKLDSARAISRCGFVLSIRNTSPYSTSKGPDASGEYPLGTTEFYFIAEYGCGKEIKCKVRVTVTNKIGPVPYCLNGLITALMPVDTNRDGTPDDGMVEIWAKDFNLGSYHPCGYKKLWFSFSSDTQNMSRVFTCADLGKNEVEIWVTDSLGNQSFCRTYLEVQNNNARIPDCKRKDSIQTGGIILNGLVSTTGLEPLEAVQVNLSMPATTRVVPRWDTVIQTRYDTIVRPSGLILYVRYQDTSYVTRYDTLVTSWQSDQMTAQDGRYGFKDLIKDQSYRVALFKTEADHKGIDINDLIVLLRHVAGIQKISDPLKLIAADVDLDGQIGQTDFDLLYALISGQSSYSAWARHWRFVPKGYSFSNPSNPFADDFEAPLALDRIQSSRTGLNFTGVRVGELDGVTNGLTRIEIQDRQRELYRIQSSAFTLENVFPNPVSDPAIHFQINIIKPVQLTLNWFDAQGKWVSQQTRSFDLGLHYWELPTDILPASGMCFYRLSDGSQTLHGKVTRSK